VFLGGRARVLGKDVIGPVESGNESERRGKTIWGGSCTAEKEVGTARALPRRTNDTSEEKDNTRNWRVGTRRSNQAAFTKSRYGEDWGEESPATQGQKSNTGALLLPGRGGWL